MGNKTIYELIRVIDSNGLYAKLNATRCLCVGIGDKQLAAREAAEGDCGARYRRNHGGASALAIECVVAHIVGAIVAVASELHAGDGLA